MKSNIYVYYYNKNEITNAVLSVLMKIKNCVRGILSEASVQLSGAGFRLLCGFMPVMAPVTSHCTSEVFVTA